ncbi:helix-turn-helix domain-containing protein [Brevundimonas sp. Root1279]|uniref:helix-turn-helix domain-containing protein n=1 Tax=Brevundimonas sp. Root1279 TaxID=1736443 RepID=UPI0006FB6AC1|nr:helix-turn-helix transcriptional regulator [Brevundimonas sp. Root1279]KQW78790.1 XRE family transcriptional regulator [Brevundimonas sp. Root1279]
MDDPEAEEIARRVREELARRRISRQALADMAKVSISTLEKALSGKRAFTLATVIRLEEALGAPLRPRPAPPPVLDAVTASPEGLGGYARGSVRWLEGRYLTLRPSFGSPGDIYAYLTTIEWDAARSHLVFAESERLDSAFAQTGSVSLPSQSGTVYLVTNVEGQYRLAILSRPTIKRALYGILSTLLIGHGSQLVPAAVPLAMIRLGADADCAFGRVSPDHPDYGRYRAELEFIVAEDFARFPR